MSDNQTGRSIEVCFSPSLFPLFEKENTIVVVIDVLRATSSICYAFANGVEHIIPLKSIEESLTYRDKGYIIAGERNGETLEGFDCGNSPFSFSEDKVRGRKIAFTTTNGTQAIDAARKNIVVIGSFLNLKVLTEWLINQEKNVICLCAGWQNKFNLEDTLFAGAVVEGLKKSGKYNCSCDSSLAAEHLYTLAKNDLFGFLENSSHRKRLERLNIVKDITFCLTPDQTNVIPLLKGDSLVNIL